MATNIDQSFEDYIDHLPKLQQIFQTTLTQGSPEVKLATFMTLNALLGTAEPKQAKIFEPLVPVMIEQGYLLIKTDVDKYGDDVLSEFTDIVECEPKLFKAHFEKLHSMMSSLVYDKDIDEKSLKESATEILIIIIERYPSIYKQKLDLLPKIIQMVFYNMVQIDHDIDKEWSHPKEGFSDAHENGEIDTDEISCGIQVIDRLMSSLGQKVMLPILGEIVQ